jgi:hypothetical protein
MCTELLGRRFWNRTACLVPSMTVAIYFGELIFAIALAIVLLANSSFKPSVTILLFCCGVVAWTLAEYITHRFVLHAIAPVQHGIHHAHPNDAVDKIFWQIWLAFAVVYLTMGGAVLAGALVAYAWYLFVHYCAHRNPADFVAETSPRPSQVCEPKLRRHHKVLGSGFRNNASMTRSELLRHNVPAAPK